MSLSEKITVTVCGEKVALDPANLEFNEVNLSAYMQKEGGWYNYFGAALANAEAQEQQAITAYDLQYNLLFCQFKDEGASDKLAESKAKSNTAVTNLKKNCIVCKLRVNLIRNHVKAWDKNHENAQSMGYIISKEMDKLDRDIRSRANYTPASSSGSANGGGGAKQDAIDDFFSRNS